MPAARASAAVLLEGVGAQRDDAGARQAELDFDGPDAPRRIVPVQAGHAHIHEDQVEARRGPIAGGAEAVDRLEPVMRPGDRRAVTLQQARRQQRVDVVVLRQQTRSGRAWRLPGADWATGSASDGS